MTARPTLPPTTAQAHPREDLHRFVNQLNVRYNVGIPIPNPNLTSAEEGLDQSPASRIYRRLKIHFYTAGEPVLNGLLRQFDERAKAYWSNWVCKPEADANTLPTTRQPPLAANLTERTWLQTIFNEVLDTAQPAMPSSRSFGRTQSGPAAFGGHAASDKSSATNSRTSSRAPSRSAPKRRAEAEHGDSMKKSRADPDPIRDLTASSFQRRRQEPGTNASASSAMGPPRTTPVVPSKIFTSFASSTTAISTASAVFSESGNAPLGTQDTNVASFEEQSRASFVNESKTFPPHSYGVSSNVEANLHRSFEHGQPSNWAPMPKIVPDETFVPTQSSACMSSMPSEVEQEAARLADLEAQPQSHRDALSGIWPLFPSWLQQAPFPIAWEIARIAHSCGVDLTSTGLTCCSQWENQTLLRQDLWKHPAFQGKSFPPASSDAAWAAALREAGLQQGSDQQSRDQQVVYTASIEFSADRSRPLRLKMQPPRLDQPHRLARHYGADRFLELLMPSPDSSNLPASLKDGASFFGQVIGWLMQRHAFCGRQWAAFYNKSGGSRKAVESLHLGPPPKPVYQERIFFFAEQKRESVSAMLKWALALEQKANGQQPVLKLYQRISLVLSRTTPAMVFKPGQIVNLGEDLLSPTGKVMNDGVGRMSPGVAKQIRDSLGLTFTPSAVQGRLGSAKGMWIIDNTLPSDEISIETYPSQRKWVMDWNTADEDHLTLEIRGTSSLPTSARFNLQFLPVLEDRAIDQTSMWTEIGNLLTTNLENELNGQRKALQTPPQFRQWVHENNTHKKDRIIHGSVPYLGGMPQEDEEIMNRMLDAGFEPKSNKFLSKMCYEKQKRKCEMLMKKLNITVAKSAYLYMVVDFHGVLEENEVHVGFSTAFEAGDDWSETMIQGTDVLVARSPAHFNSDIQRVQAVFKTELAHLKDVIVFSSKGDGPLADKLSGGDYDGDLAWVCWDPRIVANFQNAPVRKPMDLSEYMPKDKVTFRELVKKHSKSARGSSAKGGSLSGGVAAMLEKSFAFNLTKCMLGSITNYKERLCYARSSVSDRRARLLSTVLSNLVDQPKQGIQFSPQDWKRMCSDVGLPAHVDDPIYKQDHWPPRKGPPTHIIDHLKFVVAQPTVSRELKSFHAGLRLNDQIGGPQDWDGDVVDYYKIYEGQATDLLSGVKEEIKAVHESWKRDRPGDESFAEKVARVYAAWRKIQPRQATLPDDGQILLFGGESSPWELLKASTAFWMFCNSGNSKKYGSDPRFVWQMACGQLCHLKAIAVTSKRGAPDGAVGAPSAVIPPMYAALRPDAKHVKMITLRMEGGSQFGLGGDGEEEEDEDHMGGEDYE